MAAQLLKNIKTKRSTDLRRTQANLPAPSKSCAILIHTVCKGQAWQQLVSPNDLFDKAENESCVKPASHYPSLYTNSLN